MESARKIHGPFPDYGNRLPNAIIDERAAAGYSQPCALIPRSTSLQEGFRKITFAVLANAINRGAHWLQETLGAGHGETIAFIAPPDFRYFVLAWAAVKAGYILFLPSPRNSAEIFDRLLQDASARTYISASEPSVQVKSILKRLSIAVHLIPSLDEMLDEAQVPQVAISESFDQYRFKPFVKLHSSGSTGAPKVVDVKHGMITALDAYHLLEENESANRCGNMRVLAPFPPFHSAGLLQPINIMLWIGGTVVTPPPGVPITAELIYNIHEMAGVEHSQLPPSIIGDMVQNPEWRDSFGKLKGITFAGGPLPEETAGTISQYTSIHSTFGATEYGSIPMLSKSAEDWKYFRFNEEAAGIAFEETDQPNLYEMVFSRSSTELGRLVQGIFINFPHLDEYRTKDCFSKHPSKPGLWKYETRIDDILVLSNGENVSAVPMESIINPCPAVSGCLVVGQGQFQTALLVQRRDHSVSEIETAKILRPFLDKMNVACPAFARVAYDKVIFIPSDKPFPRAPKGTIQRSRATQAYHDEIERCYTRPSKLVAPSYRVQIVEGDRRSTAASLLEYVGQMIDSGCEQKLGVNDDLFSWGMDSLQVISLVQELNRDQKPFRQTIDPSLIYNHPTIAKLAAALAVGKRTQDYSDFNDDDEDTKETWLSMEQAFQDLRYKRSKANNTSRLNFSQLMQSNDPAPIYQPDGGSLAWRQVLGSFLINVGNWGLVNSFGVFQAYYTTTLLAQRSSEDISWIGTVQGALLLIVGVISGPIFDKGYFRFTQVVAGLLLVFGLMMLSLATEYYQVMLAQGILLGICAGLLYVPSVALIPLYFKRYRGLALGVATAGGPFGGVIYPIIFRRLLDDLGFGWATRIIGFVTLAIMALAMLLIKPIGPRTTRKLFEARALTDVPYLALTVAGFFAFSGILVPYFLASDFASTQLDMTTDLSFYTLAILNSAQLIGRLVPAIISDWFGPELILVFASLVTGVIGFSWISVRDNAGYLVWLVFYGLVSGMLVVMPPTVLPYISPSLAVIGTRVGMNYAVAGLGFLISTPVALALLRDAGGYVGAQCWIGACLVCAAVFNAMTAVETRKRRILYEVSGPNSHKLYIVRRQKEKAMKTGLK